MSEKRLYQASMPFYTNNGQARRAKPFKLKEAGVKYKGGVIADASFVEAPRPRITEEEKDYIEEKKKLLPNGQRRRSM